jgi:Bardet-Biedl syndrome 1 protein
MADPWIAAWFDPLAGLDAASGACAVLARVTGDGADGVELVVGTRSKHLKVVNGSRVSSKCSVGSGAACALAAVQPAGSARGSSHCIAVAVGSAVLVYRNMRPFFRFALPTIAACQDEIDLLNEIREGELGAAVAAKRAAAIVQHGHRVSTGIARLAACASGSTDSASAETAVEQLQAAPKSSDGVIHTVVTALCTAPAGSPPSGRWDNASTSSVASGGSSSTLVVASEAGQVILLTRDALRVEWCITLESPAHRLRFEGSLGADYRIAALCRDGKTRLIRNGRRTQSVCPQLPPTDVVLCGGIVIVGGAEPAARAPAPASEILSSPRGGKPGMEIEGPSSAFGSGPLSGVLDAATVIDGGGCDSGLIEGFNARNGIRMWMCRLPARVLCMAPMDTPQAGPGAVVAALADGSITIVKDGEILSRTILATPDDRVVSLQFGRFGREYDSLVAVLRSGALAVKVLRRAARLAAPLSGHVAARGSASGAAGPGEQETPLDLPKRTRLHLNNVHREQDTAADMYRILARDLRMLSLRVKREYVRVISSGADPTQALPARASSSSSSVGMAAFPQVSLTASVDVEGIGPAFRVALRLTATAASALRAGCALVAVAETGSIRVEPAIQHVPAIAPGCQVVLSVQAECEAAPGEAGSPGGRVLLTITPPDGAAGTRPSAPLAIARAHIPATDMMNL